MHVVKKIKKGKRSVQNKLIIFKFNQLLLHFLPKLCNQKVKVEAPSK